MPTDPRLIVSLLVSVALAALPAKAAPEPEPHNATPNFCIGWSNFGVGGQSEGVAPEGTEILVKTSILPISGESVGGNFEVRSGLNNSPEFVFSSDLETGNLTEWSSTEPPTAANQDHESPQ